MLCSPFLLFNCLNVDDELVKKQLTYVWTLDSPLGQTHFDEIPGSLAELYLAREVDRVIHYVDELILVCYFKGIGLVKHLVKSDAQGPYVDAFIIGVTHQYFRAQVDRCSTKSGP